MSNIDFDMFGDKPRKREIEDQFGAFILKKKITGNVLTLTGPEVEAHFRNYGRVLNRHNKFVICENNWKVFHERVRPMSQSLQDDRIVPKFKNVMKEMFLPPVHKGRNGGRTWAVVDLDFCEYVDTLIKTYGLLDVLDKFARDDLLKTTGACLIITACTRPGRIKKRFDYDVFRMTIPKVFEKNGYFVGTVLGETYKDRNGPSMYTSLYHIRKDFYDDGVNPIEAFNLKWNLPSRVI